MLIKWTLHYMVKMWAVLGLVWMCSMLWKMYHCKCFKEFKWNFCGKTRWKIFLKPGAVLDTHSFHGSCFYDTGLDLSIDKKKSSLKMIYLEISNSANNGKDFFFSILLILLLMISLSMQRDKNTFFEVSVSCTRVNKRLPAVLTDVRSLSRVDSDMCVQMAWLSKVFPTKVAVVGFLSRVNSQMDFQ